MKFIFLISFLLQGVCSAQSLQVTYTCTVDMSGNMSAPMEHRYELINNGQESVQKRILPDLSDRKDINGRPIRFVKQVKDTLHIYKDFGKNLLLSDESIYGKPVVVSDSLDIFKWTIEDETIDVLGYLCRKARTSFRGRSYIAYFAEEIPVPDGPAKFNGLPGLILRVELIDSVAIYRFEAQRIKLSNESADLANPFNPSDVMSYATFRREYVRKYKEMQEFADREGKVKFNLGGIELFED